MRVQAYPGTVKVLRMMIEMLQRSSLKEKEVVKNKVEKC